VGADYRRIIPLSILGGASALLLADILSRVVIAPQEFALGSSQHWQERHSFCGFFSALRIRLLVMCQESE